MAIMEERLTLTEDRVSQLIASQHRATQPSLAAPLPPSNVSNNASAMASLFPSDPVVTAPPVAITETAADI